MSRDSRTVPGITALLASMMLFGVAFFLATDSLTSEEERAADTAPLTLATLRLDYFVDRPLDTLFVLDTSFLEVRLDSQAVYLHCRGGAVRRFPCSTGNKKIHKAIETTEGIYCVQSKSPLAISRQFDSTKMYFWVGFNGNIGFHGLDGTSYYRFLGNRPSSHGCIRMKREDAEWMFHNVSIGTPVIVHSGTAARCLALIDTVPAGGVHIQGDVQVRRGMERQLRTWYRGRARIDGVLTHYFFRSSLWWGGVPVGNIQSMPQRQQAAAFTSGAKALALGDALRGRAR